MFAWYSYFQATRADHPFLQTYKQEFCREIEKDKFVSFSDPLLREQKMKRLSDSLQHLHWKDLVTLEHFEEDLQVRALLIQHKRKQAKLLDISPFTTPPLLTSVFNCISNEA